MTVTVATGVRLANTREIKRKHVKRARVTNILWMVRHVPGASLGMRLEDIGHLTALRARKENIRMRHHRLFIALIVRLAR